MAKWTIPDMVPRSEAHAMVAAAIKGLRGHLGNLTYDAAQIDDYIPAPADAALTKMLAEARAKGLEEAVEAITEIKRLAREGQDTPLTADRQLERIEELAAGVKDKNDG